VDRDCDAYVALNVKQFSDEELAWLVGTEKPLARYEADYWLDTEPQAKYRDGLNGAAKLLMFSSPLHQQVYLYMHSETPIGLDVARPMDFEPLDAYPERRFEDKAIWFGSWSWYKGADIAQKWALENNIELHLYPYDAPPDAEADNDMCLVCRVPYGLQREAWPATVAQYGKFVSMPRTPQAFGLGLMEAYALGLEVHVSGRVGCESYSLGLDDVLERSRGASEEFWGLCLNVL